MANESYTFDSAGVRRIVESVKRSERITGQNFIPLPVRLQGGASGLLDLRYNTTTFWIQATSVANPVEADWVNKIQVSTCPAGAVAGASADTSVGKSAIGILALFGSDEFGRSSGITEMTLSKPISSTVLLETASTNIDGTGAALLVTAGANGAVVTRIDFQANGATQAGPIRIWHQPGGSGNKLFIDQIEVEDQTPNATKRPWSGEWLPKDSPNPLMLKGLDKLYAGFYYTDKINATVNAADVT